MKKVCAGCGNYLTEGVDCPDCTMSDLMVQNEELKIENETLKAKVKELEAAQLPVVLTPPCKHRFTTP